MGWIHVAEKRKGQQPSVFVLYVYRIAYSVLTGKQMTPLYSKEMPSNDSGTKNKLNYSSYRAVNTPSVICKNESVNAAQRNNTCLF